MCTLLRWFFVMMVCMMFGMAPWSASHAKTPVPLQSAWLIEHEAFIAWYAKQQGWDTQEGFTLEMRFFPSGKQLMEAMTSAGWQIAACGALPALTASMDQQAEIIGIGNDESLATGIYTRKSSPLLGHSGYNALYPEMAGTPSTIRGTTILCTLNSSAHYVLHRWLTALGLTEQDVHIRDLPPEQALSAFLKGEGDAVVLWSPYTHEAEQQGLVPVTLSSQCGASQPTLLLAATSFAKSHPERITDFLRMYFRSVTALQETPREQLIEAYRTFFHTCTGRNITPQAAAWELAKHPVYNLQAQQTLFDTKNHKLQDWLQNMAAFAGTSNRLADLNSSYIDALQ